MTDRSPEKNNFGDLKRTYVLKFELRWLDSTMKSFAFYL